MLASYSPMRARDPRDRNYPERLTGSYLVSCILHVLMAILLFSIAATSSEEGATQSVQGGEIVSVAHLAVAQTQPAPAPSVAPPVPHAPVVAPLHHAPQPQLAAQRLPQNRHELAKDTPKAPPNPKPIPQASSQPNPQPTAEVYEPKPETGIPAVPIDVPNAKTVAIVIKVPPSAPPKPAPTAAPSAVPTAPRPQPTSAPTKSPSTPAPAATAAPSPAAVARATTAPASPAPPGPVASTAPAKNAGVPSPSPTTGAAQAKNQGVSATPGPRGTGAPGPVPGGGHANKPGPARPIKVQPTAAPSSGTGGPASALNRKLKSLLLPTGTGTAPTSAHIAPGAGAISTQMVPTPPPDVLARTQFIFTSDPAAQGLKIFGVPISIGPPMAERVEMWVTSSEKRGAVTICHGWLLRFPTPVRGMRALDPIVDADATFVCGGRTLVPYKP